MNAKPDVFSAATRCSARSKDAAFTSPEPSEKPRPDLIVNVYVSPSADTVGDAVAASGTRCDPPGAGSSE